VWGQETCFSPVLKFPRQCPPVLLVEVCLREGEVLGSEKVKFQDMDFVMSRDEKLSRGFTAYGRY
jgi:hypothetical protein